MNRSSRRGSALIMIFIAVALFAALAFAFMQSSRSSLTMIQSEASKANAVKAQQCAQAVNSATKRLSLRGCGNKISSAVDGSNSNPGAPTDGSCSIYHVNGGGVAPCALPSAPSDPCMTGPVGTACSDGALYAGDTGGDRMYIAPTPAAGFGNDLAYGVGFTANNMSDGRANRVAMESSGPGSNYPAANSCYVQGPKWYMPSVNEWAIINSNIAQLSDLDLSYSEPYWTSTSVDATDAYSIYVESDVETSDRTHLKMVWCVRTD